MKTVGFTKYPMNFTNQNNDIEQVYVDRFVDGHRNYSICSLEDSNTFYFFNTNHEKLDKEDAMDFIENYFDLYLFYSKPDDQTKLSDFYECTAQITEDQKVITIHSFKSKEYAQKKVKKIS